MSEENVELARRFYPSGAFDFVPLVWNDDVIESFKPFVHPEFEMVGAALAVEGPLDATDFNLGRRGIRGIEGFVEGWRNFLAAWETWVVTATDFIETEGERVLIMLDIRARNKTHQVEIPVEGANLLSFRDGKIVRLELFSTKAEALEAAGLSG